MEKEGQTRDLNDRLEEFALKIIRMYASLPKRDAVAQTLGRQVLRSGTSPGANYREAQRSRSKAEFISKAGDCLKELDETDYWLGLLIKSGVAPEERLRPLLVETDELISIFVAIINKAKGNKG
jgi:four helix bundle protein